MTLLQASTRRRSGSARDRKIIGLWAAELFVVVLTIGLTVALVGPHLVDHVNRSRDDAARLQIETFASALSLYNLDNTRYPTTAEGLEALVRKPPSATRWAGPYTKRATLPNDPWGHPYIYRAPAEDAAYAITTSGRP